MSHDNAITTKPAWWVQANFYLFVYIADMHSVHKLNAFRNEQQTLIAIFMLVAVLDVRSN